MSQPTLRIALAFALLLPLAGGCSDYCPPESEDFLCRYVVSIRPPDFLRPDLDEGPNPLRSDPRYPN
jgi:hypothetical protein